MGTSAVQDDPMLRLHYYRETGQADEAKQYEAYLRETGQFRDSRSPTAERIRRDFQTGNLQKRMARLNLNDAEALADEPSYAQQALGGIASLAKDIPGAEALQAGARSVFRGQPYRQALDDIRGAEASAPGVVRVGNRIAGALPAIAAMPGSAVMQGARYGIAKGLLDADPETVEERLHGAAKEGAMGAVAGKAGEFLGTGIRAVLAATLGKRALAAQAATRAADDIAYGRAATEGAKAATQPMPQAVSDVLAKPDVAPFVEMLRASRKFANADVPTLLRETYKLMSKQQGGLTKKLTEQGYDAATDLAAKNIAAAKDELLAAADLVMPSLREAIAGHAVKMGERDAFRAGADAVRRIGSQVAGKRLETQSVEAFLESINKMTPSQAKAATEGVLGRLQSTVGLSVNPLKGFGVPSSVVRIQRAMPLLEALDQQSGAQFPSLLRIAPVAATAGLLN